MSSEDDSGFDQERWEQAAKKTLEAFRTATENTPYTAITFAIRATVNAMVRGILRVHHAEREGVPEETVVALSDDEQEYADAVAQDIDTAILTVLHNVANGVRPRVVIECVPENTQSQKN